MRIMTHLYLLLMLPGLFSLSSCTTTQEEVPGTIVQSPENSSAFSANLNKTLKYIHRNDWDNATRSLDHLTQFAATDNEQADILFARAILLHKQGQPQEALTLLTKEESRQRIKKAAPKTQIQINRFLATVFEKNSRYIPAAKARSDNLELSKAYSKGYQSNMTALWNDLKQAEYSEIKSAMEHTQPSVFREWLALALIVFGGDQGFKKQILAIDHWNSQNPTHPAALIPPAEVTSLRQAYHKIPSKIAVILPFEGKYQGYANAIRDGIMQGHFEHQGSEVIFYNADPKDAFLPVYQRAVSEGAELVIGPLLKEQLQEISHEAQLPVKTLALNVLPEAQTLPANLYQFSLGSEDEILSLIRYARAENHHRAIALYEDTPFARNNLEFFKQQWEAQGNTLVSSASFTSTQSQSQVIRELLNIDQSRLRAREVASVTGEKMESEPRRRQDIDMAVIFTKPGKALAIPPLFNFYYAQDLPIYSTSSIFKGFDETKINQDLNGVRITDFPLIVNKPHDIPEKYRHSALIRMFAFGKDAFAVSERIHSLDIVKQMHIQGATGLLSMEDHRVKRKTTPAIFKRGKLTPVDLTLNR